jgi:L-lactate utilization protein LutB
MLEAAEHPNVTIHNKPTYNETLTVTKKGFDVKAVEKEWERVRKEVAKVVQDFREALGEMFGLFEMGVTDGGDGWTANLETAANEMIGDYVLANSNVNVNKGKRKAATKATKGKKGRKKAKAEDIIDLTTTP